MDFSLYGDVGWDITADKVATEIAKADGEDLTIALNSNGGDVYEGIAVMNALRSYKGQVTIIIEGLAASAASFIAVGGADRIVMRPTAELMIHEAWTDAWGNASDLTKKAADLERISANLAGIYADKAGGDAAEWRAQMQAETWFTAQEALDAGLVDAVEDGRAPAAADNRQRSKVFAQFRYSGRRDAPAPKIEAHSGQEEPMSIFDDLAKRFGTDAASVETALGKLLNASETVEAEVTVTAPDSVDVVAGESTMISLEGVQDGMTVEATTVPDSWDVQVDDAGVATVTVPADAAEGADTVELTVTGVGDPVVFEVEVKVAAAPEPPQNEEETAPAASADTVTLDRETFEELKAAAHQGWEAAKASAARERADQVDQWITEGRVNPDRRAQVVEAMERDEKSARALYGAIPKNTIPVREIGHGKDDASQDAPTKTKKTEQVESLFASTDIF